MAGSPWAGYANFSSLMGGQTFLALMGTARCSSFANWRCPGGRRCARHADRVHSARGRARGVSAALLVPALAPAVLFAALLPETGKLTPIFCAASCVRLLCGLHGRDDRRLAKWRRVWTRCWAWPCRAAPGHAPALPRFAHPAAGAKSPQLHLVGRADQLFLPHRPNPKRLFRRGGGASAGKRRAIAARPAAGGLFARILPARAARLEARGALPAAALLSVC